MARTVGICPHGAAGNGGKSPFLQVSLKPAAYGSTRRLFENVHDFLALHPGLAANSVQLLSHFTFATLFTECAPIWPFISVVAADAASSTLLFQLLKCIFVRSAHVGGVTLAGIMSLPEFPGNILLVDQPAPTKELQRVLRIMSRPGAGVPWKGQLREIFWPVVLCTAEPLRDPLLLDQAIQIALIPTRSGLPKFDVQSVEKISRRIQAMLRQYRDVNLARVRESRFDAPEFSPPTREIAALLGSCIVGDSELQARVIPLLRAQETDSRVRRMDSLLAVVIEAGLFLCHEPQRVEARVGEFTTIANGILKGRGETIQLEPRAVGDLLRSSGLFSERLGAAGRGIRFRREIREKIHELAWSLNVRSLQDKLGRCKFCAVARARLGDAAKRAS